MLVLIYVQDCITMEPDSEGFIIRGRLFKCVKCGSCIMVCPTKIEQQYDNGI